LLEELENENLASDKSKILFVDDGSEDRTWPIIYKQSLNNDKVRGIKLSRNVGHQNALLAGLSAAGKATDCAVSIDADLQDDISVIREFMLKFREGYEIVYGVRRKRDTDTFFKRSTAQGFYKMMKKMGVDLVYNHADFRLMSKRALEELQRYEETNMFLRGIVPLLGFKTASVFYDRKERLAGESKYPLKKMMAFCFEGITSFLLFGIYFLGLRFFGETETGWTSLITSIWMLGGLQLTAIGLVGEYIGKIYKETKRRPKFSVEIDAFNMPISPHLATDGGAENEFTGINFGKLSETN
jgi:glycosyltransferase involved in cell wall biosynthesis